MNCRHCQAPVSDIFIDLGFASPSNALLTQEDLEKPEISYPLKLYVCRSCWLVQTKDYARAKELFTDDYVYFSSISQSWLNHATRYAHSVIKRLKLGPKSLVIEIASNDGYLLRNFVAQAIPCLGIEPTKGTAEAAEKLGIPVVPRFFGTALAEELARNGKKADLLIGNNVYAHVPDINDFTAALKILLKPEGTITLEFPHLLNLIEQVQFDTIYHEHYSYLSLFTVSQIFNKAGLRVFDVEKLSTHGGSLRVFGCQAEDPRPQSTAVSELIAEEERRGLRDPVVYRTFQRRSDLIKDDLLLFLLQQKRSGKKVAGYGAAAKGNTLLNYAGVKPDLLHYVCDAAPSKQEKYLPGSHIPIYSPDILREKKPDMVLILPWNIAEEIVRQHFYVREWGGTFVVAVPELKILP